MRQLPPTTLSFSTIRSCAGLGLIGLVLAFSASLAHSELVIHNRPAKIIETADPSVPSQDSIVRLMKVMGIDEQIESVAAGPQAAIDAINKEGRSVMESRGADNQITERQRIIREQIRELLGRYAEVMKGSIDRVTDVKALKKAYITAAKAHYTQAEVDALIAFYDTPMGQSILQKQPQVAADFLQQSFSKGLDKNKEQQGDLLPQMRRIIKQIF